MSALGVVIESRLSDLVAKGVLASPRTVYDPGSVFDRVVVLTPYAEDLTLAETMTAAGIDLVCHGGRAGQPWTLPLAILRIARSIRKRNIAVLRGSNAFLGSLMGTLAARFAGVPSTVWLGGDNRIAQAAQKRWYYRSRRLTNAIEITTLLLTDTLLVPNQFTKNYAARVAGEGIRRKTTVIPWPAARVPEYDFNNLDLSVLGLSPSDIVVPVIGFVNRYKFSDVLFDAFDLGPLFSPEGQVKVVFCGDGDMRAEGERRFASRDDIVFTGFIQQSFVQAMIRRARVVCIPMSGMVVLEAASLGRPVVSSRVEWHSEVIEDGVTGLLVDPTDPKAWRDALSRLLEDPIASASMAQNLRIRYEMDYAAEVVAKLFGNFYRNLVSASLK
jgi:glycosyltransferase involved in cell wall biosynthesis